MLLTTFDMNAKLIVAKILLDEYGEDAGGKSHPELFRRFVRGVRRQRGRCRTDVDHARLRRRRRWSRRTCGSASDEPFLVSIGAIGEAHEYAIAFLFPPLVKGMQLAGFTAEEMEFFSLHVDHDVEHSAMLEEAMVRLAITDADCELIRRGTMTSLDCREALWDAMQRRMVAIDTGEPPPPTGGTLAALTKGYKNVPSTFWPT